MNTASNEQHLPGMSLLSEQELSLATGGTETYFNAYYDVSTGRYTLVPEGQVYVGAGMLVGPARLNS